MTLKAWIQITIKDLAMDNMSNYDKEITDLQNEVAKLEDAAVFSKKVIALNEDKNFKEVILDTLLGTEIDELALKLTAPHITEEVEASILTDIRSLRYLVRFMEAQTRKAENAFDVLARNKQLLHEKLSGQIG